MRVTRREFEIASPPSIPRRRLALDAEGSLAIIRETLMLGRPLWLEASGSSMYPVLADGDRILLAPRTRPARVGDIILVRFGRRLVLHRVIDVCGDRLTLRGDASGDVDPIVAVGQAVGLAVACEDRQGIRSLTPTLRYGLLAFLRQYRHELHRALRSPWRGGRRSWLARLWSRLAD